MVLINAAQGIWTTTVGRLAGIQALVLNARLILLALLVAATSDGAVALDTGQSTSALTVIQTGNHTDVLQAALAIRAILAVPASNTTLSIVAQRSSAVDISETFRYGPGTSILGSVRDRLESQGTTADGFPIDNLALSIRSASVVAGILAYSSGADGIGWAIGVSIRALTIWPTAT